MRPQPRMLVGYVQRARVPACSEQSRQHWQKCNFAKSTWGIDRGTYSTKEAGEEWLAQWVSAEDADRSQTAYARYAWEPWIRVKEAGASTPPNDGGEDWLLVAVGVPRLPDAETMAKQAYSPTLWGMGEIAGYLPGGTLSWSDLT